jgi:uncharacterized protein DUF5666
MKQQGTTHWSALLALGLSIACLFAGCGGDLTAGIQGSGLTGVASAGPITGFGSIFVGGVEYSTSGAQISIDDAPAGESQLRVGQIVAIKGTLNPDGVTGIATTVSFSSDVRGPITQIDANAGVFVVLGQTVRVTDATSFDDSFTTALSGIAVGTLVQVSGFPDSAGVLIASRVEPASASSPLQVRGTVQALDTTAQTFRINTLTVDYSAVAPSGTLANGAFVVVQGSSLSGIGALIATRVKVVTGLSAAANDRGQVEGVITTFTSNTSFSVAGQTISANANTQVTPQGATLGLDVRVKVQGTFDAAGVLVAERIEVRPQILSLVRGLVDAVSGSAHTLTVLGVNVSTSSATSFEDRSSQHMRSFGLADVRTGDYVQIRGTTDASGALVASNLERYNAENRSFLQGIARNVSAPNFTLLGLTVVTDAQTQFQGTGGPNAAAQFFADAPDQLVLVRGTLVGNTFLADQAQIRH